MVSKDKFMDLINQKPEWREVIEKRILVPTFVGGQMYRRYPLGGRVGLYMDTFSRF